MSSHEVGVVKSERVLRPLAVKARPLCVRPPLLDKFTQGEARLQNMLPILGNCYVNL